MYLNMYQMIYAEKNYTHFGVFENYGNGIMFFELAVRSTKSAALKNEQLRQPAIRASLVLICWGISTGDVIYSRVVDII